MISSQAVPDLSSESSVLKVASEQPLSGPKAQRCYGTSEKEGRIGREGWLGHKAGVCARVPSSVSFFLLFFCKYATKSLSEK